MVLENFYETIPVKTELWLASKGWLMKLTIFAVMLSLFLSFPPYTLLIDHFRENGIKLDAWVFIENQAEDLLHPRDMDADIRRENMIFRWTLPLLFRATGQHLLLIIVLQVVLAIGFLYMLARYIFDLFQDKVVTAYFILALSNIFVSVWSFADIHGYGDGIAFFLLLLALLSFHPLVIFIALQAAFFTDERAVVAGGYLILFYIARNCFQSGDFTLKSILKSGISGNSRAVLVAWAIYFSIRYYVKTRYFPEHTYSTLGTPVLFADAHRNGLGSSIWSTMEGTWILLLAGGFILLILKRYWLLALLFAGFSVLLTTGIFVHDIDRALAYGFPFVLISMLILRYSATLDTVRLLLFFTMIICVIHPQVFYMGYNKILWLEPLPVKFLMQLDRMMEWKMFD
ncbi:hypothetical protein [Dyadobacter helix]|nr:hypothetical protein [Dyadobacter sp. CECT 9275]